MQTCVLRRAGTGAHDPLEVLVVTYGAKDETRCHGDRVDVADGLVAAAGDDVQQQVQEERAWTPMMAGVKLQYGSDCARSG